MKTIKECMNNLEDVSVKDFYMLCWEHHNEGRMGRIRFPKALRDLHRELTNDFLSEKHIIISQLQRILNTDSLNYCDDKILEIKTSQNTVKEKKNG